MVRGEFLQPTNLPILDQVLPLSRLREFMGGFYWRDGASAVIYRSKTNLSIEETIKIKSLLGGRMPSPFLVFKVPKSSIVGASGEATPQQQLKNEFYMLTDPFIQRFAVACSDFKTDPFGRRGLLLELAEGHDLDKEEDVPLLGERDFVRIAYQLARVYQRFHDRGVSPKDVRGLVYRKEFDLDNSRPSAYPPRVVLYDLAWGQRIQSEGEGRHLDVWRDTLAYLKNLQTLFAQVPKFKLKPVQKLIEDIAKNPSKASSFLEIASYLDKYCVSPPGLESYFMECIVGSDINLTQQVDAEKLALTRREFIATLEKYNLTLNPQLHTLGKDAYVTEGLLVADAPLGTNLSAAHFVELYLGDLIERVGLRTRAEIMQHVHGPGFPKSDLPDLLTPHPTEGTLLDALLSKLVAQGIITEI